MIIVQVLYVILLLAVLFSILLGAGVVIGSVLFLLSMRKLRKQDGTEDY